MKLEITDDFVLNGLAFYFAKMPSAFEQLAMAYRIFGRRGAAVLAHLKVYEVNNES